MRPATVFFPESPGFLLAGYNINHVISMSYIIIENSMAALIIKLLGQKVWSTTVANRRIEERNCRSKSLASSF